jgi:hypothetical protein
MTKDSKKYPLELDDYECSLILNNAVIFGQLKATLTRMSKKDRIDFCYDSAIMRLSI